MKLARSLLLTQGSCSSGTQVTTTGYIDSRMKLTDIDKIGMPIGPSTLAQLCDDTCQMSLPRQVR